MKTHALQRVYVWEFPVRLFHWLTVLSLVVLTGTGLLMGSPVVLTHSAEAWSGYWFGWVRFLHYTAGYILLFTLVYRLFWAWAGNSYARWSAFVPVTVQDWRDLVNALRGYLFIDRWTGKAPAGHNRLQGLAYFAIVLLIVFQVFTGFGMYAAMSAAWIPKAFAWVVPFMGGDLVVLRWHHLVMWAFIVFLVVHVYMAFLNERHVRQRIFMSIVTGWKDADKP